MNFETNGCMYNCGDSCSVCKSCEREICPRCDSRLIKYKVVDVNGKSLNKNSYICTYCSFISDLDVKHYN
jgi:hypothetical protein